MRWKVWGLSLTVTGSHRGGFRQGESVMKQILIIEDDMALANGLCRALSLKEMQTISCDSLQKARQILAGQECVLVLLDVNLPDGNGFDFLKEVKKEGYTGDFADC